MANCLALLTLALASMAKSGRTFRPHYHFLVYDASPGFVGVLKDRWEALFGFCDVKHVNPVNKDGSLGYVKVSRYIAKYISKPSDWIPWISEGICERPRRMSSLGFGRGSLPLEELRQHYLAVGLSGEGRLERIVERKKSLTVMGTKFPLPRRIAELVYYDKVPAERFNWKKQKYEKYKKYERTDLSRMVLAYEKRSSSEAFEREAYERFVVLPDMALDNEGNRTSQTSEQQCLFNCAPELFALAREKVAARLSADFSCFVRRKEMSEKALTKRLASDSR